MKKTLQTLLLTLLIDTGCSSAITSENVLPSNDLEIIITPEAEPKKEECYYLKENEQVIPDNIVETYLSLVGGERKARFSMAYHINHFELTPQIKTEITEINEQFYQTMYDKGYSQKQILAYLTALNQSGNIVIKESVLREPVSSPNSLREVLEHERIHHEFDKRPITEKKMILSLHQELMRRDLTWKEYSETMGIVFYTTNFGNSEFVAHLVQDAWYLIKSVKEEFPVEYEILSEIKKEAKVDARACNPSFERDTTKKEELK